MFVGSTYFSWFPTMFSGILPRFADRVQCSDPFPDCVLILVLVFPHLVSFRIPCKRGGVLLAQVFAADQ